MYEQHVIYRFQPWPEGLRPDTEGMDMIQGEKQDGNKVEAPRAVKKIGREKERATKKERKQQKSQ